MSTTMGRLVAFVVLVAPLALGALPMTDAYAQGKKAAASGAKPEAGKLYEDWGIQCEAQADKTDKCFAAQFQTRTETGQRILSVNVGYLGPKGETMIVAFLPLGIDLTAGTAVRFEPGPQVPLAINTCVPEGCRATAILDAAGVKAMREAKTISLLMIPSGKTEAIAMAVSVKGLAAAYAALK